MPSAVVVGAGMGGLATAGRLAGAGLPHNRHARYRNLYFVGASTHPGTGVPIVLISARLVVERVLRDMAVAPAGGPPVIATG